MQATAAMLRQCISCLPPSRTAGYGTCGGEADSGVVGTQGGPQGEELLKEKAKLREGEGLGEGSGKSQSADNELFGQGGNPVWSFPPLIDCTGNEVLLVLFAHVSRVVLKHAH